MSNSKWFANDGKCDVCGRETKIVVCASTMGPVSLAYCKDCLENRAEPYSIMTAYIACAGKWPDDISPEYQARVRRLLAFHKKTEAEFSKDVADLYDEDMYD